MTRPPLIAVPAYLVRSGRIEGWATSAVAAPEPYLQALRRAGAAGPWSCPTSSARARPTSCSTASTACC